MRRLTLIVALVALPSLAADWPHPRGPELDGRAPATGTFADASVGLDLAWRIPIGSGYSAIAVAAGRAVTAFSDATADWIAAFDATTGKPHWRRKLGAPTKGHDGSDDGPLSSPVVSGGRVFALGAAGELHALRLADGEPVWSRKLTDVFGAKAPDFGFTTTPVVAGETLVVQAGGPEGKSIVGLAAATGETLWTHGSDGVSYQSPAVMTLAGQRQLVAVSDKAITGLDPASGKVLWEHALGEQDWVASSTPTHIGDDRFVLNISGDLAALRVGRSSEGYEVEELYRTTALGQSYAPPVHRDGYLYGFRGQVLTCAKAADGERVWRSREPGGDGLILVDERLVIYGSKGNVVVADASPEGYKERARLQALEGSALTWPSFAEGRIFVRNLSEMAAVSVTSRAHASITAPIAGDDTSFGRFVAGLDQAADPRAEIDRFLARHATLPIVEGNWVHFVWRGEAEDVAISGSMLESEAPDAMQQVEGTDLFYRSYPIEPGARWEYQFNVDYEKWVTDPHNPGATIPAIEGEDSRSELVTTGYRMGQHFARQPERPGRVDAFKLSSKLLGEDKEIKVWLPAGGGEQPLPLLIVNDGPAWADKGRLINSLDNLVGKSVRPIAVAFVPPAGQWWTEAGGARTDEYARMLVEELLPALRERYPIAEGKAQHGIMGNRFYAFTGAYTALKYPDVFGRVGVQSVYTGLGSGDKLEAMLREKRGPGIRFYVDWNRYDERNVDRGWDLAEDTKHLDALLRQQGYAVEGGEMLDSSGWGGWRNRADRVLIALFPADGGR